MLRRLLFVAASLGACGKTVQDKDVLIQSGKGVSLRSPVDPFPPRQSFMPENRLHELDDVIEASNITEADFNSVIDTAEMIYAPIFQKFGARLQIEKRWSDATVNAYAEQVGNVWKVSMFGGLARRPEVTADGFAMVVCHEIGHHLGGFPFYSGDDWAATEGQSDYFATQECAKKIWKSNLNPVEIHPTIASKCDAHWTDENDRKQCYRAGEAGKSLAELLGGLNGEKVDPSKKDAKVVSRTNTAHPAAQCRFDTYLAAALCSTKFNPDIIPGKGSKGGNNSAEAEAIANSVSCSTGEAARPRCWYAPRNAPSPQPNPTPNPNPQPQPDPQPQPEPQPGEDLSQALIGEMASIRKCPAPFVRSQELDHAAKVWADWMALTGRLSSEGFPWARDSVIQDKFPGSTVRVLAENVSAIRPDLTSVKEQAVAIMQTWLRNGAESNIRNCYLRSIGIGFTKGRGADFVTADFGG